MRPDNNEATDALAASGFPFQTAVASSIRNIKWRADDKLPLYRVQEEVAWDDRGNLDRFIDIVASHTSVQLLIECKKTTKQRWTFLLPFGGRSEAHKLSSLYFQYSPDEERNRYIATYWGRIFASLKSYESKYCVIGGAGANDRLLEREIQPLVRSVDAYAQDLVGEQSPAVVTRNCQQVPCVPMVITNTSLYVASYDPLKDVDLASGAYKARQEHLSPVKFIRFTKEFTVATQRVARERTVLIVHVDGLEDVLRGVIGAHVENYEPVFMYG